MQYLILIGTLVLSGCSFNFHVDNESAAVKGSGKVAEIENSKEDATNTVDVKAENKGV